MMASIFVKYRWIGTYHWWLNLDHEESKNIYIILIKNKNKIKIQVAKLCAASSCASDPSFIENTFSVCSY